LGSLLGAIPTHPIIAKMTKWDNKVNKMEHLILQEEIKQYVFCNKEVKSNLAALHSMAWG
jgi:hypothetical protein